jgi:hypothetical protein
MTTMKEERKNAEKRLWQTLYRMAAGKGLMPVWQTMGYEVTRKKVHDLIAQFHDKPDSPGFYGLRIPVGETAGIKLDVLIENQKELIIGIQPQETGSHENYGFDILSSLMVSLAATDRSWNFEAPGWLGWKTPDVRINFRSFTNKALQDIMLNKDDSEALYLIAEEITDILQEIRNIVTCQNHPEYGTVAN